MIHLDIHSDIKDGEIIVKYLIPVNLKSEDVTCEIPYASIDRKRIKRTEKEKGKWEMNMQKWIDISDSDFGVTVVNNNRYGFNATRHGIYLTLTRTPEYPGVSPLYGSTRIVPKKERPKYIDLVPFDYKFGIIPHSGGWKEHEMWKKGQEFNLNLIVCQDHPTKNTKNIDFSKPFIHIEASNILVGSIKPTEWNGSNYDKLVEHEEWAWDTKTFILRLIELHGIETKTNVILNNTLKIKNIEEVDLLERNPTNKNPFKDNRFEVSFTPFEIKTLRINIY
jgi:alpha-mannosidase